MNVYPQPTPAPNTALNTPEQLALEITDISRAKKCPFPARLRPNWSHPRPYRCIDLRLLVSSVSRTAWM